MIKRFLIFHFLFIAVFQHCFGADSLTFTERIKKFAYHEMGTELNGDLFTKTMETDKPYIYLYISKPDKIQCPEGFGSFVYCNTDEDLAKRKSDTLCQLGYQTFCYKTYANSAAMLNQRYYMYAKESESFIVFHELMHNYIAQLELKIPYEFNEALCDVMGNYGTMHFFEANKELNLSAAKNQLDHNENIYWCLNKYIDKINANPKKAVQLNQQCDRMIKTILTECNLFQNDRFNFAVNNAYLLKNEYYCKNYFLLKKVLLKQKAIKDFLEIIKSAPASALEYQKYLLKYT